MTGFSTVSSSKMGHHRPAVDVATVVATREVRWFAEGPLPQSAIRWFRRPPGPVMIEHRVDSYLVTGQRDLGMKRRNHGDLEIKRLRASEGPLEIQGLPACSMEEWVKTRQPFSIDDAPLGGSGWIDVEKTLLTRLYPGPETRAGTGCEVELASVTAGNVEAWSLAFEAFGPDAGRVEALHATIEGFFGDAALPEALAGALELPGSYPEWLDRIIVGEPPAAAGQSS